MMSRVVKTRYNSDRRTLFTKINLLFYLSLNNINVMKIKYLLLSIENVHCGSSNGNMFNIPWQDRIKWRLKKIVNFFCTRILSLENTHVSNKLINTLAAFWSFVVVGSQIKFTDFAVYRLHLIVSLEHFTAHGMRGC